MQPVHAIFRRWFTILPVLGLSLFANGRLALAAPEPSIDETVLQRASDACIAVADKALPAVVFINVELAAVPGGMPPVDPQWDEFLRRYFGEGYRFHSPQQFRQNGQGSGFIIRKDGYILTNHHVVGAAAKIMVRLHDGREFQARLVGTDSKSEIAVIKIEADDLPVLLPGESSKLRVGEWVMAIGNPFGLSASVSVGVVSGLARDRFGWGGRRLGISDYENFIQTDAAINPGNSGGPLVNIHGEVVGVNTAIFSGSGGYMGIGFAVPMDMARTIVDQLITSGKVSRGFLGIVIGNVTAEMIEYFGLKEVQGIVVSDVMPDSPAARAGLKRDDVILEMNGKPVNDVSTFRYNVAATPPDTDLALVIFREGNRETVQVRTGTLPDPSTPPLTPAAPPAVAAVPGLRVGPLTEEIAQRRGYDSTDGVLVEEVEESSPAAEEGIQEGDVIVSVNRRDVRSLEEYRQAMQEAAEKGKVLLRVKSPRGTSYVVIKLPAK